MLRCHVWLGAAVCAAVLTTVAVDRALASRIAQDQPFGIKVVDADTGRGIPRVALRATNKIRYYTDSNGLAAITDPGLLGRKVYFHVHSAGYESSADGFGYHGKAIRLTPGGKTRLKLHRLNIAQRLYRVTGEGIYEDSVRLGRPVPIEHPLLNGGVMGQDSVQSIVWHNRIYWFWGDTDEPQYPLGNFKTTGAVSKLPAHGGGDPAKGVNLNYFTDKRGLPRPMVPLKEKGVVWISGLMKVKDSDGRLRLLAHYRRLKGLGKQLGQGMLVFNRKKRQFERLAQWPDDAPTNASRGQAFQVHTHGRDYWYFANPYPLLRVRGDWRAVCDPAAYEAFTCLTQGSRFDAAAPDLDRDDHGQLIWDWKADTAVVGPDRQHKLVKHGEINPGQRWWVTRDVKTGRTINLHTGSVHWNAYRDRWIMIAVQKGGDSSFLGEVWYTEADKPEGPWPRAVKIITHDHYSFYNPAQHPFFDQDGGRVIYLEGTYAHTFSSTKRPTPRYDYNQIMYRLDLSAPRLKAVRHEARP